MMKQFFRLIFLATILVSCGSVRTMDVEKLKMGMSANDVEDRYGKPSRVVYGKKENGVPEQGLEYKDKSGNYYTLVFQNKKLARYELVRGRRPAGDMHGHRK